MSSGGEPPPAKLFAAVMMRPGTDPEPALSALARLYGAVDGRSAACAFTASRYYEPEMGPGLVKFHVSFAALQAQESLVRVKREARALEAQASDARGRTLNIDPGIVTLHSVILATGKGFAHRVYLGGGVYAEPELLYRAGAWQPLPWTYPDYRTGAAHAFFDGARLLLRRQLAGAAAPAR